MQNSRFSKTDSSPNSFITDRSKAVVMLWFYLLLLLVSVSVMSYFLYYNWEATFWERELFAQYTIRSLRGVFRLCV